MPQIIERSARMEIKRDGYLNALIDRMHNGLISWNGSKEKQEKAFLLNVQDSLKKIVIVKDVIKVKWNEYGITTMSIYDLQ